MNYIRTYDESQSPAKLSIYLAKPNLARQIHCTLATNGRVSLKIMNVWTIFSPYYKRNITQIKTTTTQSMTQLMMTCIVIGCDYEVSYT